MTDQSAFSKKNIENAVIPPKHDLLDELHLPPVLVTFIRQNARMLQVVAISLVVVILAWIFYDQYSAKQRQAAAANFAAALQLPDQTERVQAIEKVAEDYSGTPTAIWAELELGHLAFQAEDYDQALTRYDRVLDDLDTDNPVMPLLRLSIAQSLEFTREYEKALTHYNRLIDEPGYAAEVYPAMGRIYEMQGDTAKAVAIYEKYLALSEEEPVAGDGRNATRLLIEDKLTRLKEGGEAPSEEKEATP